VPLHLVPLPVAAWPVEDRVVDLAVRRSSAHAALRAVADAPVRHVPAALLEALQGSWGTPQEVLGVSARPVRLAVAR
jgi:hypothetical protein